MILGQIFCKLAYPSTLWSCVVFFFCDDRHSGGSKWRCKFRSV